MSTEEPLPEKVQLSEADFKVMAQDELILRWKQYEAYVQALEAKFTHLSSHVTGLRESAERLKQQQQTAARRRNILVLRLATQEQEMRECAAQARLLRRARPRAADPAVGLFFVRMKGELDKIKDKLEQTQNELSAWKFTPGSQTGQALMAKCRLLLQENQELGRQLSQGRIARLEAELALQRKFSEQLSSSRDELSGFVLHLEEEVEGMQSTVLSLEQQLKEARQQLAQCRRQRLAAQPRGPAGLRLPSP